MCVCVCFCDSCFIYIALAKTGDLFTLTTSPIPLSHVFSWNTLSSSLSSSPYIVQLPEYISRINITLFCDLSQTITSLLNFYYEAIHIFTNNMNNIYPNNIATCMNTTITIDIPIGETKILLMVYTINPTNDFLPINYTLNIFRTGNNHSNVQMLSLLTNNGNEYLLYDADINLNYLLSSQTNMIPYKDNNNNNTLLQFAKYSPWFVASNNYISTLSVNSIYEFHYVFDFNTTRISLYWTTPIIPIPLPSINTLYIPDNTTSMGFLNVLNRTNFGELLQPNQYSTFVNKQQYKIATIYAYSRR